MTYREMMKKNDENLGWCKPLSWKNGRVVLAINDGTIAGIKVDGKSIEITPENIKAVAQRINSDYSDYSGWDGTDIINDCVDDAKELPCRRCPWFGVCDAMDEGVCK